jgi:hypothetical protein
MQELRGYISTFAASGVGASYTELYDSPASVSEPLAYLSQKFPWSRSNYLTYYGAALGSSDCFHKLEYASQKIENALSALSAYADAKTGGSDPGQIEAARKAFIA